MKLGFMKDQRKTKLNMYVYDTKGGSNYVEAAFHSYGIADEQFAFNIAPRLSEQIKEVPPLNWCPAVEHLLEEESVSKLLLKLLSTMKKKQRHKELSEVDNPAVRILASLITYFITEKRTLTSNLTVVLHGITRSKELIDMLHKCEIYISYNDLLFLCNIWALLDTETSKTCPRGITFEQLPIVIVDNDDLKIDSLTGNATGAYQTNVLCMQLESYEEESNNDSTAAENVTKKEMSNEMDMQYKELTTMCMTSRSWY